MRSIRRHALLLSLPMALAACSKPSAVETNLDNLETAPPLTPEHDPVVVERADEPAPPPVETHAVAPDVTPPDEAIADPGADQQLQEDAAASGMTGPATPREDTSGGNTE